jgi:hypothetical protein
MFLETFILASLSLASSSPIFLSFCSIFLSLALQFQIGYCTKDFCLEDSSFLMSSIVINCCFLDIGLQVLTQDCSKSYLLKLTSSDERERIHLLPASQPVLISGERDGNQQNLP